MPPPTSFTHLSHERKSAIVFTDLDATLLESDGSILPDAILLVRALAGSGIPVVPVTSKTRREVAEWLRILAIPGPAIFENGAGTLLDDRVEVSPQAIPASDLAKLLDAASREADVSVRPLTTIPEAELQRLTGLSPREQQDARSREYSVPFLVTEQDLSPLRTVLDGVSAVSLVRGGRFWHLMGRHSKSDSFARIRDFRGAWGTAIGLGDAPNDIPILAAADLAAIIPGPRGASVELTSRFPHAFRAARPAGAGWIESIRSLIPPDLLRNQSMR